MIVSTRRHVLMAALAVGTGGLGATIARAQTVDPAIPPVDNFYEALMDAMRHAQALKVKGRYDRLEPVMMKSFDVPAMVRGAIGGAFNTLAAADQASLRTAFAKLLVATFASTFDDWKGEKFVITPDSTAHGADKFVKTQFVNGNVSTDINYLLRNSGSGWRIVDVYLNGNISQLATWRSQYGSVLQNGGPQALLHAVDAQTTKFMAVI
jgi:phospholipid transport system substrate-binding protein